MSGDIDSIKYFMASEKMMNLIFVIEQTMEFMTEYSIKPDEEVKKALTPIIDQLWRWLNEDKKPIQ